MANKKGQTLRPDPPCKTLPCKALLDASFGLFRPVTPPCGKVRLDINQLRMERFWVKWHLESYLGISLGKVAWCLVDDTVQRSHDVHGLLRLIELIEDEVLDIETQFFVIKIIYVNK